MAKHLTDRVIRTSKIVVENIEHSAQLLSSKVGRVEPHLQLCKDECMYTHSTLCLAGDDGDETVDRD